VSEISEIKADIEHTREELAAAVDSLSARLDAKAAVRRRVDKLQASLSDDDARMRGALAGGGVLLLLVVRRRRRRRRRERENQAARLVAGALSGGLTGAGIS
jgi:uncharacterized protein with von Willebrand factor type A (vWA) domain